MLQGSIILSSSHSSTFQPFPIQMLLLQERALLRLIIKSFFCSEKRKRNRVVGETTVPVDL
jgi:hypothetical protein